MLLNPRLRKNRLTFTLLVLAAWTGFGIFFGTQNYLRDIYVGRPASLPGYMVGWLLCGYSWAFLTVPILRFARHFSLHKLGWSRFLLTHLPLGVVFASFQLGLYVSIAASLFSGNDKGIWELYKFIFVKEFQSSFLVYWAIISAVTAYDRIFGEVPAVSRSDRTLIDSGYEHLPEANGNRFLQRIPVKENGRIVLVETEGIEWVESYGNYVFLHTPEKRFIHRETMAVMERKLDPSQFVRIRRSAIIRTNRIKELRPTQNSEFEIKLASGLILISTRRYRKNLEPILNS